MELLRTATGTEVLASRMYRQVVLERPPTAKLYTSLWPADKRLEDRYCPTRAGPKDYQASTAELCSLGGQDRAGLSLPIDDSCDT